MAIATRTSKTGKAYFFALITAYAISALMGSAVVFAAEPQFSAQVDRSQIGVDDSVSLKFHVQAEGTLSSSPPEYEAPDFQEINSYDSSFVESYYDSTSGRISMRNNQTLTKILKPMRQGSLKISRIRVTLNGKSRTAPDIVVQVGPSGSGTPPPRNYGGGGVGLRGALKRPPANNTVFVRAEVDKEKVFKGEQVVVSYYLYRRVRVLNAQVDKFPVLNGFLREELEMPIMQPRLEIESVVLDGVPYQRSLLARYAAYPLQEGKLKVDAMGLKYNYYAQNGQNGQNGMTDDGEDPFLQFFQQLTPREASTRSEPVTVDVQPLPTEGRPASFSGGVGDFMVLAAVDKYEVRANEAIALTVKVEGRGNLAAIGEPKTKWPPNVELYDSKGTAKSGRGGIGEKIFEILLIPRTPGPLTLPAMEFSFFDPNKKQYVTRTTDPIQITVGEAAPGSSASAPSKSSVSSGTVSPGASGTPALRGLMAPTVGEFSWMSIPFWRILYVLAVIVAALFAAWVGWDFLRGGLARRKATAGVRARAREKSWDRLRSEARSAGSAKWSDVLRVYDRLCENVLDTIDQVYGIGARSLPRAEIRRILIDEKGFSSTHWEQIDRLLEFNELIRFAGTTSPAIETRARNELPSWVSTAESAVQTLSQ